MEEFFGRRNVYDDVREDPLLVLKKISLFF